MYKVKHGNILESKCKSLVIPSNGCAIIGSKSLASFLCDDLLGGKSIEQSSKAVVVQNGKPFEAGSFFMTHSCGLQKFGFISIYHAVLSKYPGEFSSLYFINKSMKAILESAISVKLSSIAFSSLGTGMERLDYRSVASNMVSLIRQYHVSIDISVVDVNKSFINEVERLIS